MVFSALMLVMILLKIAQHTCGFFITIKCFRGRKLSNLCSFYCCKCFKFLCCNPYLCKCLTILFKVLLHSISFLFFLVKLLNIFNHLAKRADCPLFELELPNHNHLSMHNMDNASQIPPHCYEVEVDILDFCFEFNLNNNHELLSKSCNSTFPEIDCQTLSSLGHDPFSIFCKMTLIQINLVAIFEPLVSVITYLLWVLNRKCLRRNCSIIAFRCKCC